MCDIYVMDSRTDKSGYVYCFKNKNPRYNKYIKIGLTTQTIKERLNQANNHTFKLNEIEPESNYICLFAKRVSDCYKAEREAHEYFKDYRYTKSREFFEITYKQAVDYFKTVSGEWDPPPSSITSNNQLITQTIFDDDECSADYDEIMRNFEDDTYNAPITILDITINNLTTIERYELMNLCMERECIEARMIGEYYYFDSIKRSNGKVLELSRNMRFNAILNSPDLGYFNITSDNFDAVINDLRRNAPYSFVELDQRMDDY